MNLQRLRDFTSARVALGRAGNSLPTTELLALQLAHARARQAVHTRLDPTSLAADLQSAWHDPVFVRSTVPDRANYLRRPDLGRYLDPASRSLLLEHKGPYDVAFILVDGLAAQAVQRHAAPTLQLCLSFLGQEDWKVAPLTIVEQGRVAIGDDVAACLSAAVAVVLIGERPGLSAADSLGIYLTWHPRPETTDADRNCISNIRAEGLSYEVAAHRLHFLMAEARRRKLTGVNLKEDAPILTLPIPEG